MTRNSSHETTVTEAELQGPQDCIDNNTVVFDLDTVVNQGGKRSVNGHCALTGRDFEVVYLAPVDHPNPSSLPLLAFDYGGVWQYSPARKPVEFNSNSVYSPLKYLTAEFNTPGAKIP